MTDDGIIETYGYTQGLSPEEILIQKEKMEFIIEVYRSVQETLSQSEFEDFMGYVLKEKTYYDIGWRKTEENEVLTKKQKENLRKRRTTRGYRRIKEIKTKLKKLANTRGYLLCKDFLLNPESNKEADVPKQQLGWMCTRLQKTNMGGQWSYNTDRKQKEYKPVIKCTVPEYLTFSFNNENTPVCSMCGIKCSRKSYFKEHNVKLKYKTKDAD